MTSVVVAFLTLHFAGAGRGRRQRSYLLVWAVVAAVADLLPVQLWGDVTLSMSLPVTLAAGMVLSPWNAGLVAFVGSSGSREFRREVSCSTRSLQSKPDCGERHLASSVSCHGRKSSQVAGSPSVWPSCAGSRLGCQHLLVMVPVAMMTRLSSRRSCDAFMAMIRWIMAVGYLCLGLLAVLLAAVYGVAGGWGLVAAVIPLALARQMFKRGTTFGGSRQEARRKGQGAYQCCRTDTL